MSVDKETIYQNIINWCSLTNAEIVQDGFYHWTDEAKRLSRFLETRPPGQLIAVIGPQGSGKTRMMFEIAKNSKKRILQMKWPGLEYLKKQSKESIMENYYYPTPSKFPGHEKAKEQLEELLYPVHFFMKHDVVLIDLPDYNKRSIIQRDKHLDQIQWLRNTVGNRYRERKQKFERLKHSEMESYEKAMRSYEERKRRGYKSMSEPQMPKFKEPKLRIFTLVLFIQQELWSDHFFLNKFKKIFIKPLKAKKLLEIFRSILSESPFTDEAIFHIGLFSRGVFRRFMEYIDVCIENWIETDQTQITLNNVKEWISPKRIVEDMDVELSRYVKKPENRIIAVKISQHLQASGETSQSTLMQMFFANNKTRCSRVLNALEPYYFLHESRGREKFWRLREVNKW